MRSLRKIPMRLRSTNFCILSAHFAPSFVRQPKGPECTQLVRNAPKRQFIVQRGGTGAFVAKNYDATSWHELLHHYDRFAPSFVTQPNGPQCTKIVRNAPNFCTSSGRFAPSFVTQPNGPQCPKVVRNAPKHEFRVE